MTHSPTPRIDAMMGFDSAAMGDEREARVLLQATSFGAVISVYTTIAVAAGLALTGNMIWSFVLLLIASVPSTAISIYAARHRVSVDSLLGRSTTAQLMWPLLIVGFMVATWAFGIVFHLTSGHPVIPTTDIGQRLADSFSDDGSAPVSRGLGIAGVVAAVLFAWTVIGATRKPKSEKPNPADIPDED